MQFKIERYGIKIIPEDDVDRAYIEDTLGLKKENSFIRLARVNALGFGRLAYIQSMTEEQWKREQERREKKFEKGDETPSSLVSKKEEEVKEEDLLSKEEIEEALAKGKKEREIFEQNTGHYRGHFK